MRDPALDPLPPPAADRRALRRAAGLAAGLHVVALGCAVLPGCDGPGAVLAWVLAGASRVVLAHALGCASRAGGLTGAAPLLVGAGVAIQVAGRAAHAALAGPIASTSGPGAESALDRALVEVLGLGAGSLELAGFGMLWLRARGRGTLSYPVLSGQLPGLAAGVLAIAATVAGDPVTASRLGRISVLLAALGLAFMAWGDRDRQP